MTLIEYLALLMISLVISIMLPMIDLIETILTSEGVNVGEFQIGIFLFLAIMSTVGLVVTYRG